MAKYIIRLTVDTGSLLIDWPMDDLALVKIALDEICRQNAKVRKGCIVDARNGAVVYEW